MLIEIDRAKWEVPLNRLPPRQHSTDQQAAGARGHRGASGREGRPIPNILETLTCVCTMKPTCFGLLDFTEVKTFETFSTIVDS